MPFKPKLFPGLSLEWRLGIITSLVVIFVMGSVTSVQQMHELDQQRIARELLLRESLAPLAATINKATKLEEILAGMITFHEAYLREGYVRHEIDLWNNSGQLIFTTRGQSNDVSGIVPPGDDLLSARFPVSSHLLTGERGVLAVYEDASEYKSATSRQWASWLVHVLVTALSIVICLLIAVRLLVLRPLYKLIESTHLVGSGYRKAVEVPDGAWEIRWLARRFRRMNMRLEQTVRDLLAAQRRAKLPIGPRNIRAESTQGDHGNQGSSPNTGSEIPGDSEVLEGTLRRLRRLQPDAPNALKAAKRALRSDAVAAERIGSFDLKNAIEDAAFSIIAGKEYHELRRDLDAFARSRREWVDSIETEILKMLKDRGVRVHSLEHRVKHAAGVWSKMKRKGLSLERVHDLFGFRIVVGGEGECYLALGAVHDAFVPIVGRFKDYIARPKINGYRSLHTSVRERDNQVFEVQIRSISMQDESERGNASHWKYKKENVCPPDGRHRLVPRLIGSIFKDPSRPPS